MLAYTGDASILIHVEAVGLLARMPTLSSKHQRPKHKDLFSVTLAEQAQCPLLTGDATLRSTADTEYIEVKDTVWLVAEILRKKCISPAVACAAFERMREGGRRLPWDVVGKLLKEA